jgi:hypothetical protein
MFLQASALTNMLSRFLNTLENLADEDRQLVTEGIGYIATIRELSLAS